MANSIAKSSHQRTSPRASELPMLMSSAATASTKLAPHRVVRKGSVGKKPLVPLAEARQYNLERSTSRGTRETESEKWDASLDNTSAARDGRQFAVSNVGNHGRIYLRPSVRRNNSTSQNQQSFNLPTTPPQSFGSPSTSHQDRVLIKPANANSMQWAAIPRDSPITGSMASLSDSRAASRLGNHRRALSDSTIHEVAVPKTADAAAAFAPPKTSIDDARPRTMDDLATASPLLNINIPNWRLGTPRFTVRGTALIRGSSYAPTEDLRSSTVSMLHAVPRSHHAVPEFNWNKPAGVFMSPENVLVQATLESPDRPPSPLRLRAMRSTYLSTHLIIEPEMFTDLTFRPASDDRRIVRYASTTGSVAAATPPRLVAEITSPSFLDYELISDFFLTYRSFLESLDLLRMLFARMRWALARQDEIGMIVRVRTFVATRHWILNYFTDDFLLNYNLRKEFCDLLNGVVDDLSDNVQTRTVQLRVIAELKKCWRRVCAHYWDGPNFDDTLGVEATVVPGGIAGHRDPTLSPSYWQSVGQQPQLSPSHLKHHGADVGFSTDPNKTPKIGDFIVFGDRPLTPENVAMDLARAQEGAAHISMDSMDVLSCAFPGKALKSVGSQPYQQWAPHPHPVLATAQITQPGAVAITPRALVGKRVRPAHSHKRSNSVSDSLREHLAERPPNDVEFPTILPSAGSLVRGNILPPGQAFVDTSAQGYGGMAHRQTTVFTPPSRRMFKDKPFHGAMSGIGMKKLLASVRRALSARGQVTAPTQANLTRISLAGPRNLASSRLPGTAVVPQEEAQHNGSRPAVRIDLLGAEVAEDFKKAVREGQTDILTPPEPSSAPPQPIGDFSFGDLLPIEHQRPTSDMGITTGSKSIVIVDDTIPFELHQSMMLQQAGRPSVDTLTDSFMPATGDPTPPNTPPANVDRGTPRRSSYLIHPPHSIQDLDVLPPFIPDLATLQQDTDSRISEDIGRPSFTSSRRRYPPLSSGTFRMHRRTRSSKTHQSLNSILHRRHSSFGSGVVPPSTIRSFDATTVSEVSLDDSEIQVPEPLRVLRRRPGGDLRTANRVGDLEPKVIRRSQSVGSIVTYSESVRSRSFFGGSPDSNDDAESDYSDYRQSRREVFSVGQLTKQQPKKAAKLSLFSTHSSKPVMRPSFEAEAQRLAQIPDDEDDGGIESALLKLEGKYSRRSKDSVKDAETGAEEHIDMEKLGRALQFLGGVPAGSTMSRRQQASTGMAQATSMGGPGTNEDLFVPGGPRSEMTVARSFLSEASVDSYNSIPLLDRGLTEDGGSRRTSDVWAEKSVLRDSEDLTPVASNELPNTSVLYDTDSMDADEPTGDREYDLVEKTDSMERIVPGETQPSSRDQLSFLEDDSYANSAISSELSTRATPSLVHPRRKLPPHPLHAPVTDSMLQPVSPPLSTPRQLVSPTFVSAETMYASRPLPPTPDATPTVPFTQTLPGSQSLPAALERPRAAPQPEAGAKKYSVHLPFILAFDSDILAQQFTLIEKDALNEIDWKELIEMNWKNATSSGSRSWVDFLRNSDAHGVEVVIARFNIMVKWAISEIVLTQHVEERARCIIKMIHIAAHCRRYRNFATLAQLTMALSSNEVARLSKTWTVVPAHDLRTLAELEALVTPTRNFLNLRAEMEVGTDTGCIPFVGIYTHDLLYNAQRPSEIASSPETAPLVNFERCRIAAAVVKVLLRLLESSTHYTFQPIEGITERCLWVGALSDEEIRGHSEALES